MCKSCLFSKRTSWISGKSCLKKIPFPLFPSPGSSVSSPSVFLLPRFSRQSHRTRQNCVTYMQDHLTSLFRLTAGPYFEKRKRWFSVFSMGLSRKNSSRKNVLASQSLFLVEYYFTGLFQKVIKTVKISSHYWKYTYIQFLLKQIWMPKIWT